MPIYEYQCRNCEHKLETLQKISDDPLKLCPACEKPELKKLVSAASFRLKGAGWYETDFKTGNKKQLADSDSAPAKKSDEKKDAGADKAGTKPEKKASDNKKSEAAASKPSAKAAADSK